MDCHFYRHLHTFTGQWWSLRGTTATIAIPIGTTDTAGNIEATDIGTVATALATMAVPIGSIANTTALPATAISR